MTPPSTAGKMAAVYDKGYKDGCAAANLEWAVAAAEALPAPPPAAEALRLLRDAVLYADYAIEHMALVLGEEKPAVKAGRRFQEEARAFLAASGEPEK